MGSGHRSNPFATAFIVLKTKCKKSKKLKVFAFECVKLIFGKVFAIILLQGGIADDRHS